MHDFGFGSRIGDRGAEPSITLSFELKKSMLIVGMDESHYFWPLNSVGGTPVIFLKTRLK